MTDVEKTANGGSVTSDVLLGCPFCGSDPTFPAEDEVFGTCYESGCEDCGIARIDFQIIDMVDDRNRAHESYDAVNHKYGTDYIREVRNKAIEMWNSRQPNA